MTWLTINRKAVQITVTTEQCLHCGKYVRFVIERTCEPYQHVRCPACGTRWTLHLKRGEMKPHKKNRKI